MTPNLHRINIVLLVVKSDFANNNVKLCCDSTRKVLKSDLNLCISLSRPAWDAWIEISSKSRKELYSSRVPHGTRGLKYISCNLLPFWQPRRVPHGTRGLKFA